MAASEIPVTTPSGLVVEKDELTIFVHTKLVNEKNAREGHWGARKRRAQTQRDAVSMAVLQALRSDPKAVWKLEADPDQPKAVTIVAHVFNKFDSHDGLRAACSHLVDGLADARLIGSTESLVETAKGYVLRIHAHDADKYGHTFAYEQIVDRQRLGATISVRLRKGEPASA